MRNDFKLLEQHFNKLLVYADKFEEFATHFEEPLCILRADKIIEKLAKTGKKGALKMMDLCRGFDDINKFPDIQSYVINLNDEIGTIYSIYFSMDGDCEKFGIGIPDALLNLGTNYLEYITAVKRLIDVIGPTKEYQTLGLDRDFKGFIVDLNKAKIMYDGQSSALRRSALPYRLFCVANNDVALMKDLFNSDLKKIDDVQIRIDNFKYDLKMKFNITQKDISKTFSVQRDKVVLNNVKILPLD